LARESQPGGFTRPNRYRGKRPTFGLRLQRIRIIERSG
jgi:hypothetical protein